MKSSKDVTLQELHEMYITDPTKIYVVEIGNRDSDKENTDEKDTGDC